jgi:hypothetical protein
VKHDPVDRFALHEAQDKRFTEELEEIHERKSSEDSFASKSKARNIVVIAMIAVIVGIVLWILYPHFVSSSKPEQKTPPPLFVPSKIGGGSIESKWPEIENRIAHAIAQRGIKGIEVNFIGDTAYLRGIVKTEREREPRWLPRRF